MDLNWKAWGVAGVAGLAALYVFKYLTPAAVKGAKGSI